VRARDLAAAVRGDSGVAHGGPWGLHADSAAAARGDSMVPGGQAALHPPRAPRPVRVQTHPHPAALDQTCCRAPAAMAARELLAGGVPQDEAADDVLPPPAEVLAWELVQALAAARARQPIPIPAPPRFATNSSATSPRAVRLWASGPAWPRAAEDWRVPWAAQRRIPPAWRAGPRRPARPAFRAMNSTYRTFQVRS
jgi:hypothetical protein